MLKSNFKNLDKPKDSRYTIYKAHSDNSEAKEKNYIRITSIDPGGVNLAFSIIKFFPDGKIKTQKVIRENVLLKDKETLDSLFYRYDQVNNLFDEYLNYLINSHYILVESQMTRNPQMVRMMQHIITYMMIKTKDKGVLPVIIEICPKLKTQCFNGPIGRRKDQTSNQAKNERKEFCKNLTRSIFLKNKDPFIKIFERSKKGQGRNKLDDCCDTICQAFAWLCICQEFSWWDKFYKGNLSIQELIKN